MSQAELPYIQAKRWVYYILGILETLLAFRLILKLLGANPKSGFAALIYSLSQAFLAPFSGIFRSLTSPGIETPSVFEPATMVAMVVYALIAYGIARIIDIRMHRKIS